MGSVCSALLSEQLVLALGTQLDIRLLSSLSSCFIYCVFRGEIVVGKGRKGKVEVRIYLRE
jgi:hypothetical protein